MFDAHLAWPHAPTHRLSEAGTFLITAGTYRKLHHFRSATRLDVLHRGLLKVAAEFGWRLEAWAVFSNHYHCVAHSPQSASSAESLSAMLRKLHGAMAIWVNRLDRSPRRKVWHNFWETRLTLERSYLVRLNYVHQNAVRHGLVREASEYPWCSAGWLKERVDASQVRLLKRIPIDRVRVQDDFEPVLDR